MTEHKKASEGHKAHKPARDVSEAKAEKPAERPLPEGAKPGPSVIGRGGAQAAALALAKARGLDAEHTGRLVGQYVDTYNSRWSQTIPTGSTS